MKKLYRLGEKISEIKINGTNMAQFTIAINSASSLKAPPLASAEIEKAAEIFQTYIHKITDLYIPIICDSNPVNSEPEILIGGTIREEDDSKNVEFGDEEYLIKTVGKKLIINGGKRGILYGVYSFFENYTGVRFFTKDLEKFVYKKVYDLKNINESFVPAFEYREICDWRAWNSDFSVKSKINGSFVRKLRDEDGYGVGFSGGFEGLVHTFSHLMPYDKYYASNPEYFAIDEFGKRNPLGLCVSNPMVVKETAKNAIEWLNREDSPELISISINDGNIPYCTCENCKKMYDNGWNKTDSILNFVNQVAEIIALKYPKVKVDTISYADVSDLPNMIKPNNNVIIRVCGSFVRSMSIPAARDKYIKMNDDKIKDTYNFSERIKNWATITDKIYVWDYPYNYYVVNSIYPVIHTLLPNKKYFKENNVKGVYINGETDNAEFNELKLYLTAKVLWDPDITETEFENLLKEFLEGYYGQGWRYIYEYIILTENLSKENAFTATAEPNDIIKFENNENGLKKRLAFIKKARGLFDKAKGLAENKGEEERIAKSALQVDYYELYTTMQQRMKNDNKEDKAYLRNKNKEVYYKLLKYGVVRIVENTFIPKVKNFNQSPIEWGYWDPECTVSDRNNETYSRKLVVLLPVKNKIGEKVNISFFYKTNNENKNGFISLSGEHGFIDKDRNNKKINPKWDYSGDYKRVEFKNVFVTNLTNQLKYLGMAEDDFRLSFIKPYMSGIFLVVDEMDAGAYLSIKDIKVN